MCFSFAFVGCSEEKASSGWGFSLSSILQVLQRPLNSLLEHCYMSSMFVWTPTSNVLFFSVLADFNQVKPAWSERIKHHTDLASFASWWNTEKYSSLGNWILSSSWSKLFSLVLWEPNISLWLRVINFSTMMEMRQWLNSRKRLGNQSLIKLRVQSTRANSPFYFVDSLVYFVAAL